jgi:hypothetical protein
MTDHPNMNTFASGTKRHHDQGPSSPPEDVKRYRITNSTSPVPSNDQQGNYTAQAVVCDHQGVSPSYLGTVDAKYLVVHEVLCTHHPGHRTTFYEDCPRLFAGDARVAALRGKHRIDHDVLSEDFAEENPDIGFIVVRSYNCGEYHAKQMVREDFSTVSLPDGAAKALAHLKAQLSFLKNDGPQAIIVAEQLYVIGHELKMAMNYVHTQYPQHFPNLEQTPEALKSPYLAVYHARSLLSDLLQPSDKLNDEQRAYASCMFTYIQTSQAAVYKEADSQFSSGNVSKHHFSKLFSPNDIVVQETDHGPMGYSLHERPLNQDRCVILSCWNWDFDGTFFKKTSTWTVEWPSEELEVPITSLSLYPLRFDATGLREKLYDRGEKFWTCRKQRLVECDTVTLDHELGAVSFHWSSFSSSTLLSLIRHLSGIW